MTTKKTSKKESGKEGPWTKIGAIAAVIGVIPIVIGAIAAAIALIIGVAVQTHRDPSGTVKTSANNAPSDTRSPTTLPSRSSTTSATPTQGKSDNPTAHFESPKPDTMVSLCYTAAVTFANIPAGKVLWFVVLAPNKDDTKPTEGNLNGGRPYIAVLRVSASGIWSSQRLQLGDPGDVRPYWLDLYMADSTIQVSNSDEAAQFSLLRQATFLSEIHVQRAPVPAGTKDGSCKG